MNDIAFSSVSFLVAVLKPLLKRAVALIVMPYEHCSNVLCLLERKSKRKKDEKSNCTIRWYKDPISLCVTARLPKNLWGCPPPDCQWGMCRRGVAPSSWFQEPRTATGSNRLCKEFLLCLSHRELHRPCIRGFRSCSLSSSI